MQAGVVLGRLCDDLDRPCRSLGGSSIHGSWNDGSALVVADGLLGRVRAGN